MTYDYSSIIEYLLDWYDLNARILPWRENPKPYNVLISEIMLQQTRVEAVKMYFDRFTTRLPDIGSLANVEEEKLLKLWEGLGYYNRARNLKKAAQIIMKDYEGTIPADYKELLTLPGIGPYTAGAIASIAYQIPVPAVDGNVLRVLKRVEGSFDDIKKEKIRKRLEQDLLEIIPQNRPGDFNQSIMELGATVCIPNGKPLCNKCPIMHLCTAFHKGIEMIIPVKGEKKPRRIVEKTVLLFNYNGEYGLRKREDKGLLASLWEFPSIDEKLTILAVEDLVKDLGLKNQKIEYLGEGKHIFSHIEWHMTGYYIKIDDLSVVAENTEYKTQDYKNNKDNKDSKDNKDNKYKELLDNIKWVSKESVDQDITIPTAFDFIRKKL